MIRLIIGGCCLFLSVFAQESIIVNETFSQKSSLEFQTIYEDTTHALTLEDILSTSAFHTTNLHSAPATQSNFWTKFSIKNEQKLAQTIVLRHPRAGLDEIDIFVFKDETMLSSHKMGDLRSNENRSLVHRNSVLIFDLEPNATYSVISRFHSYGPYELFWSVETPRHFAYYSSMEMILWGLFGGVLIALCIYNFSMFTSLKDPAFLIYSLHVLTTLWHQFTVNGILYQYTENLNLHFLTVSAWVSPYLALTFLILFPYFFFKMNRTRLGKSLLVLASLSFLIALYYLSALENMDRLYFTTVATPFSMIVLLFLIGISITMFFRKACGSGYFLLGQGIFLLSALYFASIIGGYGEHKSYSWLIIPMGTAFDLIFLSLALAQRIRLLKEESLKNETALIEQARFYSIGQTIGNIAHQWKTPLSQLSSHFMALQANAIHGQNDFKDEFKNAMPKIQKNIDYMKDNIELFYNFYTNTSKNLSYNPKMEIETILKMLEPKLILENIQVTLNIALEKEIFGDKNAFSNILMILFENAIDALSEKKGERKILLSITEAEYDFKVIFEDNAGGINPKHINTLFSSSYSEKKGEHFGLGLSIAKTLIEQRLKGTVAVTNTPNGAKFEIAMRKEKEG